MQGKADGTRTWFQVDTSGLGKAEHHWHLDRSEEKQNEELILVSRQILELTRDIHTLTKGSGRPLPAARPSPDA